MMKTIYSICVSKILRHKVTLILLFATLFGAQDIFASHAAGADLTYQYLGDSAGQSRYLVTYTLYRDCFGITVGLTHSIEYGSVSCNRAPAFVTLPQVSGTGYEITRNCSTALSTCHGGSATGVELWAFQGIVSLPAGCPDWYFSAAECCRNAAITTLDNPGGADLFIDAYLNNTVIQNNSPTFTNVPIAFMCIGQANYFNVGAIDTLDGDSLVYSFAPPRADVNTPIAYNPGYSLSHPLTTLTDSFNINPVTGDIFMWPTAPEVAVIAVLIREYRNGQIIGTVMRDIQIYTTVCTNILPVITGIDGSTTNFQTSTCGGQICFDILSSDVNSGDSLFLTWNHAIPGATFSVTGPWNAPVGRFCWTPSPSDARPSPYTFTATIRDNACPSNGVRTVAYSILVSAMNMSITHSSSVPCNGAHNGTAAAHMQSGVTPFTYVWSGPNGLELYTDSISRLYAGNYTVNVTDATGCMGVQNFTISEPPALALSIATVNAGCNASTGSATANVTGGTGTYTYLWSDPTHQTTQTASNLQTSTYTVQVKDANLCPISGSASVVGGTPMTATMSTTGATCLANDGSATVTATGGNGPISYVWTPNVSSTNTATGLIAGSYQCMVSDTAGCSITLNGIVANLAGITATIVASGDATCETSDDGTATVMASGGTMPYYYLWPNGDTTASVNNLAPGTYVVRVEDYHQCRAYASVTIGFTNPSPVVNLGPDTVMCLGTTLVLDAGAGFTSYLWSDNSAGQTLAVSAAGTYSVLVSNAAGCQNFDAIVVSFVQCPAINNPNPLIYNSNNNAHAFTVSPNPFKDQVIVNISKLNDANVRIIVLDVLGNQLYSSMEKAEYTYNKTIDLHQYAAGIYLMRIEYNGDLKTVRLVKE